jgi:hypothetical protein
LEGQQVTDKEATHLEPGRENGLGEVAVSNAVEKRMSWAARHAWACPWISSEVAAGSFWDHRLPFARRWHGRARRVWRLAAQHPTVAFNDGPPQLDQPRCSRVNPCSGRSEALGDHAPDRLDNAEWPSSREKAMNAREQAPESEGQDESPAAPLEREDAVQGNERHA